MRKLRNPKPGTRNPPRSPRGESDVPRDGRQPRRGRGFTLIELLVVIAIIGIVANIVIPGLIYQIHKARAQRIVTDFLFFRQNVLEYHMDTGEFPRDRRWGVAPAELADYLKGRMQWDQSEAGIWYDWENWVNKKGKPRRPSTGVARGFSVLLDDRKHRMMTLIPRLYPEDSLVIRGRKLIFVIEPAG